MTSKGSATAMASRVVDLCPKSTDSEDWREERRAGGQVSLQTNHRESGEMPPRLAAPLGGYKLGNFSYIGNTPAAASE